MSELAKCKWCGKQIRKTVVNPGIKAERVIWSHDFQAPAIPCFLDEERVAEPAEPSPEVKQEETCVHCEMPIYATPNGVWAHIRSDSMFCPPKVQTCAEPAARPSPEVAPMQGDESYRRFCDIVDDFVQRPPSIIPHEIGGLMKENYRVRYPARAAAPRETQGEPDRLYSYPFALSSQLSALNYYRHANVICNTREEWMRFAEEYANYRVSRARLENGGR